MNMLITAGNTQVPLDQVRAITNIFTGKTGALIADTACSRGHSVTLLTSNPETLSDELFGSGYTRPDLLAVIPYRTFDELTTLLQQEIRKGLYDVVIQSAAISDYISAGVFSPRGGTTFNVRSKHWENASGPAALEEQKGGKIRSTAPELWVRLQRAPKLVDRIRKPWGFAGLLVKFKLEVGLGDTELIDRAEESRLQSDADLMVANTLEGSKHYALIGPIDGRYERVPRRELPEYLLLQLEELNRNYRAARIKRG